MSEQVIKTVENVDKLFSQIIVNGETFISDKVVEQPKPVVKPSTKTETTTTTSTAPKAPKAGEDVYAVDLNDVLHNFTDRTTKQNLTEEIRNRTEKDTAMQTELNTVKSSLNTVKASVEDIQALIPNQATKDNQLADKDFVNSSISTNTANFLGTFNTLEEIEALTDVTNNDYAFWKTTDTLGSVVFKRYKYIADEQEWKFEYDLNNSSFTAEQWEAINSGITAELVAKIGDGSAVVNSILPIGAPMAWLSEVPPVGFLAFDGSEYNQEDFPELYEVIKNIPSFHSDTEGKFKIPNLKGRVLQGADTVIGELIEAGLPNIIGEVKNNDPAYGSIQMVNPKFEGAFSGQFHGNAGWSGSVYGCHTLKIDASKGETKADGTLKTQDEPHVYGNSDTVQMDAFTVYWVIKATNYVSLEKNAIDGTKTTKANAWSAEKINKMVSYTTGEMLTGGTYLGKPIYRKAGRVASMETGYVVIDPILTSSYIDSVVAMNATGISGNDIIQFGGYVDVSPRASLSVYADGFRKLDGSPATTNFNWWIEYTKASD